MRIGKQDEPYSAISTSTAATIHVRGKDLCRDVIGQMDFTSYFWLLVTGREPTELDPYADLVLHDEIGPVMTVAAPAN